MTWLDEVRDKAREWDEDELVRQEEELIAKQERETEGVECFRSLSAGSTGGEKRCSQIDGHSGPCCAEERGRIDRVTLCRSCHFVGCSRLSHDGSCDGAFSSVFPIVTDSGYGLIPEERVSIGGFSTTFPCEHVIPGRGRCTKKVGHRGECQGLLTKKDRAAKRKKFKKAFTKGRV